MHRGKYIQYLHQSSTKLALSITGGGSLIIGDLLSVPGASGTVIDATVPYSADALVQYLGKPPEQFCSLRTTRTMAVNAFHHARHVICAGMLRQAGCAESPIVPYSTDVSHDMETTVQTGITPDTLNKTMYSRNTADDRSTEELAPFEDTIGVACNAALATDRTRKGEHRIYVALQTLRQTMTFSLLLQKGARTRLEEEILAADLILNAVETARQLQTVYAPQADAMMQDTAIDIIETIPLQLKPNEKVEGRVCCGSEQLVELFYGKLWGMLWQNGCLRFRVPRKNVSATGYNPYAEYMQAILPGSFNPIHTGHIEMIKYAESWLQSKVALELSISNADKPPLDYIDLADRLKTIRKMNPDLAVWLTQTPLFGDKADLFRGATFVIGADTLRRFADLRFYQGNIHQLQDILRLIAYHDCRFLVFARESPTRGLETLETMNIPDMLRSLSDAVPPEEFCINISSTHLRKQQ